MDADLMLSWMSETGSGEVQDLRQRVTWLARTTVRNPAPYEAGRWLRDVASLGHAEVDWDGGRWAMAPAVGVLLPASGGTAVLAGARRIGLVDGLEAQVAVQTVAAEESANERLPVPSSVYIQADSVDGLAAALKSVDAQYSGCAARLIADRLPALALGALAAPPSWSAQAERLVLGSGFRFGGSLPAGDGLCRLTLYGRPRYLYRSGSDWYHTDHAHGILWALAERNVSVFRWRLERTASGEDIGTAFVDQGAPLPPLQARALVLCSGLPTQFGNAAKTAIYRNVPKQVAQQVADSIRQHLSVVD
jgi:hypothetical protein